MRQDRWKIPTRYRRRADALPTAVIALYDRAQELEIDGRSDMDKDELIEALRSN